MGDNVVPRQEGDAYQAMVFWFHAGRLFQPHTYVEKVYWESSTTGGFDDVIINYRAGKLENGEPVARECLSVKHHVDHRKSFTCDALINPDFINSTKATILSRLYDAYQADPTVANHTRFRIINTWTLDRKDPLGTLVRNDGAIDLAKLFDGKSDSTKYGKIRKAWREHLGVDDTILREVLRPLRIDHSFDDLSRIVDRVSDKLQIAKLQPIDAGLRHTGYVELIQRLHAEGKKEFTRDEIMAICQQEGFVIIEDKVDPDYHVLGVRSFRKGAEDLESKVHELLCLQDKYTGRYLNNDQSWEQICQQVQQFADRGLTAKKQLKLLLDTHLSLAFTMGYTMDIKSGAQVTLVQKTMGNELIWRPDPIKVEQVTRPCWQFKYQQLNDKGSDLVVALSATHVINENVMAYVHAQLPNAAGILSASMLPQPSTTVFQSAEHIVASAQEIVKQVRAQKVLLNGRVKVHLFMAAPNAFSFFLGQLAKPMGRLTLYEYDFEGMRDQTYHPCISLPANQPL